MYKAGYLRAYNVMSFLRIKHDLHETLPICSFLKPEDPVVKPSEAHWAENRAWRSSHGMGNIYGSSYSPYTSSEDGASGSFGDYHENMLDSALDSESESEGGMIVVPKCNMASRKVAYIVSKPSSEQPMTNLIVYTNSSALPLLVSVKSQWSSGEHVTHAFALHIVEPKLSAQHACSLDVHYLQTGVAVHDAS